MVLFFFVYSMHNKELTINVYKIICHLFCMAVQRPLPLREEYKVQALDNKVVRNMGSKD